MSIRRQLGDLAKSLDSSAVGSFLSKGASEADFTTIAYSDVSGTPSTVADSAVALSIIDSAYVQARVTTVAAGLDSATTINLLDSNYMAARSGGGAGFYVYNYDATAGQTTFQDSDAAGNVMSYSADGIIVFYNGVMLPTADYTATDGTSVVLGTGADSQDVVTIAKWSVGSGSSSGGSAGIAWGGDRAFSLGGGSNFSNVIEYLDITTPGNASDFGDLSAVLYGSGTASDGSRILSASGFDGNNQLTAIEYITSSTLSNATSFGSVSQGRATLGGHSDATYGIFGGGGNSAPVTSGTNTIDYVTIQTTSNASDFGDLITAMKWLSSGGDGTYALWMMTTIEYVTITTPGNASDFGDVLTGRAEGSRSSGAITSETISVFAGGGDFFIDYVTTATPGNATDFGDLLTDGTYHYNPAGTSNGNVGIIMGGITSSNTNVIQNFTLATPGNASDFGDLTVGKARNTGSSGSPS